MIHSRDEFRARARAKKARAWAAYLVRFAGPVPSGPAAWRATIAWVTGLTPDAWARLSTHSRQHPPSAETVRLIVAHLGDLAMGAIHHERRTSH